MLYYYTTMPPPIENCPDGICANGKSSHGTLFQEPVGCKDCQKGSCNALNSTPHEWLTTLYYTY